MKDQKPKMTLQKYGTVYNTVAPGTRLTGVLKRAEARGAAQ